MEIWKTIENTHYSVSNTGRIRNDKFGRILNKGIDKNGYALATIKINGKFKTFRLHRLVARSFIPNPDNLPEINHINGIKTDNNVENLEWITRTDNLKHAWENNLHDIKPVCMLSEDGEILKIFESTRAAGREMGVRNSSISSACHDKHKCCGYYWSFKEVHV